MGVKRISNNDLFVCVGKVLRPVGVEGALKVQNYTDIPDRFENLAEIYIGPTTELAVPYSVNSMEYRSKNIILTLEQHESIDFVEHLRGYFCYLPRLEDHELEENEFLVDDLIGLDVEYSGGEPIGTVKDILSSPANDVLIIRREQDEVLLPMVGEFIREVNVSNGRIIINPVDGILE